MADLTNWSQALAGNPPPLHEDEPWSGYYKMRDRRGLNKKKSAIKRPFIACAIWRDKDGQVMAERAKTPVPVDWIWPYCARHPISFETYAFWHANERWPEMENVK